MAINLYDSAKKISKDGTTYMLVKSGSKNCFDVPGNRIIDNNLHTKYTRGETRESDWSVIAKTKHNRPMAVTQWNCPLSQIYGKVQFGNRYNIALYLDRLAPVDFNELDEEQQTNFNIILSRSQDVDQQYMDSIIDLDLYPDLPENKQYKTEHEYCGHKMYVGSNHTTYRGRIYWKETTL